jgi:hypothetical protein
MEPLLRAEWAPPPDYRGDAAQPHWHFDRPFESWVYPTGIQAEDAADATEAPEEENAEPGDPAGLQELELSGIHLGMAGWHHGGEGHQCWQCAPKNMPELQRWALRTIAYMRSQTPHVQASEVLQP